MQNVANDLWAGDRVFCIVARRRGIAKKFLHDGNVEVLFDGTTNFETVRWNHLVLESALEGELNRDLVRIADIDQKFNQAHGWGSWMAEASNERYALVEKAQKFGRDIEHKYVMRSKEQGGTTFARPGA